jgi:hypothetical protein
MPKSSMEGRGSPGSAGILPAVDCHRQAEAPRRSTRSQRAKIDTDSDPEEPKPRYANLECGGLPPLCCWQLAALARGERINTGAPPPGQEPQECRSRQWKAEVPLGALASCCHRQAEAPGRSTRSQRAKIDTIPTPRERKPRDANLECGGLPPLCCWQLAALARGERINTGAPPPGQEPQECRSRQWKAEVALGALASCRP